MKLVPRTFEQSGEMFNKFYILFKVSIYLMITFKYLLSESSEDNSFLFRFSKSS